MPGPQAVRFETSRPKTDEERTLPLINVVFLLLIFFMLSGRLSSVDPFQTEPPRSASEGQMQEHETVVYVGADGRLALDGTILDETTLRSAIDGRGALRPIRLKADGKAHAVRVVAVMELLRAAGVEKVDLLTMPDPP